MSKESDNYKITKNLSEKKLKEICSFFKVKNLQEFELIEGDLKINLKATPEHTPATMVNLNPVSNFAANEEPVQISSPTTVSDAKEEKVDGNVISAPISGTCYSSPSPNDPPYIAVGDSIKKGDRVCIIEAMKVMNEIESPFSGKVIAIKLANGKPVKQGQALVVIK